ncbi:7217_t:CDS:1 [Entrophospora sp. SA101]|nr:17646_t:CDS:1 [Entrophospora sp. SA101]CAJ0748280.1 17650_t:CDS:1 [Entrophospora sp. SA101]CAJ0749524.1 6077_t:CDS:1 [Entrophospora sp. SA101]CAJ0766976.1 7217_t:CDS:1 [Entrophospora sp. SA101]
MYGFTISLTLLLVLADKNTYEEMEQKIKRISKMKTPSLFCKPKEMLKVQEPFIYNHRPHSSTPITLYHRVFATFQANCHELKITKDDCRSVIELVKLMEKVFKYEKERKSEFNLWLSNYFNEPVDKLPLPADHQEADIGSVVIIGQLSFVLLIGEIKNEIGEGGGCAYVQACASYAKQVALNRNNVICQGLNPAFLLYLAGPYLGIGGAVLGKEFTMEPLTPMFPLLFMKNDLSAMESLTHALLALKVGIKELKNYYLTCYEQIRCIENNALLRPENFPQICQFMIGETSFTFSYMKQLHNEKLLFLVKGLSGAFLGKLILVKFVKRYGIDAHIYCADQGIAPKFYAYNKIPGWSMVVMEYLTEYVDIYTAMHDLKLDQKVLFKKAEETIKILHDRDFVHGNLQASSILVSIDMRQMRIVDFVWSGLNGKVFYPYFINNSVPWHHEVDCGKPIRMEHDKYIFKKILGC